MINVRLDKTQVIDVDEWRIVKVKKRLFEVLFNFYEQLKFFITKAVARSKQLSRGLPKNKENNIP